MFVIAKYFAPSESTDVFFSEDIKFTFAFDQLFSYNITPPIFEEGKKFWPYQQVTYREKHLSSPIINNYKTLDPKSWASKKLASVSR